MTNDPHVVRRTNSLTLPASVREHAHQDAIDLIESDIMHHHCNSRVGVILIHVVHHRLRKGLG